jgi:hypothetical protein
MDGLLLFFRGLILCVTVKYTAKKIGLCPDFKNIIDDDSVILSS